MTCVIHLSFSDWQGWESSWGGSFEGSRGEVRERCSRFGWISGGLGRRSGRGGGASEGCLRKAGNALFLDCCNYFIVVLSCFYCFLSSLFIFYRFVLSFPEWLRISEIIFLLFPEWSGFRTSCFVIPRRVGDLGIIPISIPEWSRIRDIEHTQAAKIFGVISFITSSTTSTTRGSDDLGDPDQR